MNPVEIRPHDILRIAGDSVCVTGDARQALECFHATPWVVVRRASCEQGRIPIGIRGNLRSERFAGFAEPTAVREVLPPESLRVSSATRDLPAFAALAALQQCREYLALAWGPTGSVGFELATGVAVVRETSDLDVLLRFPLQLSVEKAHALYEVSQELPCAIDIQVETPYGAFALAEYLSSPDMILLRTLNGPQLVHDPWCVHGPVTA
jgi:phosphoribosyl-dephospho-CoA transferase